MSNIRDILAGSKKLRIFLLAALAVFLLYAFATTLHLLIPASTGRMLRAMCRAEAETYYAVAGTDGDTLYISLPGTAKRAALQADSVATRTDISAAFVTANGHAVTSDSLLRRQPDTLSAADTRALLLSIDTTLAKTNRHDSLTLHELDYYARTHSVEDDGYNEVMAFREELRRKLQAADSTLARLRRITHAGSQPVARLHAKCRLIWNAATDSARHRGDTLAAHVAGREDGGLILLQAESRRLPYGATQLTVIRYGTLFAPKRLLAFNDFGGKTATLLPAALSREEEKYAATEGGVWINTLGNLCGVCVKGGCTRAGHLPRLLHKARVWQLWWIEDIKEFFGQIKLWHAGGKTDSPTPSAARCMRKQYDAAVYLGQTRDGKTREGWGSLTLANGTRYEGLWGADTLAQGIRTDSAGVYCGAFGADLQPEGHGTLMSDKDGYYRGTWKAGKRDGSGFAANGPAVIRCGVWSKDRFKGERMVYTATRVYGIDISRYQHEIGRKRYAIHWDRLRITGLGTNRRVKGQVDYPVSFVYVKATQGKTIYNRYYAADIHAARARGIAAGAYHFFSTLSPADKQAAWFVKKAAIAAGDMPPVLDVEPTDKQIARMGGEQKLFSEMLRWLHAVERACGKRPVLYLGQRFVNEHLPHAPAALRAYDVWIARYGEYKPYVHLLHWQLTPYGRVQGITGDVDINVFNGTREEFAARFH